MREIKQKIFLLTLHFIFNFCLAKTHSNQREKGRIGQHMKKSGQQLKKIGQKTKTKWALSLYKTLLSIGAQQTRKYLD